MVSGSCLYYIASVLKRNKSTISREIKRLSFLNYYSAHHAHVHALQRIARNNTYKLDKNKELMQYVVARLHKRWSPEQISAMSKIDFSGNRAMNISRECIYRYIYTIAQRYDNTELIKYLRRKRKYRISRIALSLRRRYPYMVSIDERPQEVNYRTTPGHWEGDLVAGKDFHSAVGTLVERVSRKLIIVPLRIKKTEHVTYAFVKAFRKVPEVMKQSLTYDQGTEMSRHLYFTEQTGMPVYFAHPSSPWERGTNENTNGLLRDYFPKGTDFSKIRRKELKKVEKELNQRPRKILNWLSPEQYYREIVRERKPVF